MVSGTLSLPSSGCFSPFPHGTRSLSVSREYLALPDGPGGFAQDSSCPALLRMPAGRIVLRIRGSHPLRPVFPDGSPRIHRATNAGPTTPVVRRHTAGLGSSPVARHYWGNHCYFLFLRVLRCFSSPGSPQRKNALITALQAAGLSHSDTRGSKVICTSPRIFAAYRVLHRLREPRHPPCALIYFRTVSTTPSRKRETLILSAVSATRLLQAAGFSLVDVSLFDLVAALLLIWGKGCSLQFRFVATCQRTCVGCPA